MGWEDLMQYEMPQQGAIPTVQAGAPDMTFAANMQPAPATGLDFTPAASPEEENQRRVMWTDIITKFQTNPNLQRALALTGAMMMQPIQPGQTTGGALANSAVVGMNAYNMGQMSELSQGMQQRQEQREERRLRSQEAESAERVQTARAERPIRTRTMTAQARTAEAGADVAGQTTEDQVQRIKMENQRLKQAIDAGNENEAVAAQRRINEVAKLFRERELLANTPVERELKAQLDKFDLLSAQMRGATAKAGLEEEEYSVVKELTPEEKRSMFTAKRGTSTTAIEAMSKVYGDLWDKSPQLQASHPNKASYIDQRLSGAKSKGPADQLKAYMDATADAPELRRKEVIESFQKQIREEAGAGPERTATMADVRATARIHKRSEEEVIKALEAQGIRVIR